MKAHTKLFEKRIEEPVPGAHVAIGYGLANVIVIDAPDGLILVDTLESIRAAQGLVPWLNELRQSTGKQITDVIYTHNHADHAFGAGVLLADQDNKPRIWAQEQTQARVNEVVGILSPITFKRAMRMFGTYLPNENFENNGIGPRLLSTHSDGFDFVPPTDTVGDYAEVTMAGEKVVLIHAPGETDDQLAVYLPDRSLLLPADNYYHAFPNIYTVRGTPYRDPRKWAQSLDIMSKLNAETMIPQHSQPVLGAAEIHKRLTDYRDAIQFVYDETIRMINAGLTPDEIAEQIELPPHLANAPYLKELYGRVDFAARAVFSGTLGWFSGDPVDLRPPSPDQHARLMAELAGGNDALLAAGQASLAKGDASWALILGTQLQRLGDDRAAELRATALRELAARETASSVRNYFLTSAAEADGFTMPVASISATPDRMLNGIPIDRFLGILTTNVDASAVQDKSLSYGFEFTDAQDYTIRINRGVAYLEDGLADDNVGRLTTTTDVFRAIAVQRRNPAKVLIAGDMQVIGSITGLTTFLGYFNPPLQEN
ncbi:alkyl sulfatase dimerization domain-containing protein [Falsiruegeria litorea]|uniref:alkyl sulfatase dimerization domain-containing protein n=1 Tax=Falsiruegeria litorea TaxID=1280831 RepID=UPI0013FDBD74|nr:alkyl sulfatase dimerization domain-containing protein [Falsiruegeria litorea]